MYRTIPSVSYQNALDLNTKTPQLEMNMTAVELVMLSWQRQETYNVRIV